MRQTGIAALVAGRDVGIWLSTTGDVLNDAQQAAFERYIQAGGGYAGRGDHRGRARGRDERRRTVAGREALMSRPERKNVP